MIKVHFPNLQQGPLECGVRGSRVCDSKSGPLPCPSSNCFLGLSLQVAGRCRRHWGVLVISMEVQGEMTVATKEVIVTRMWLQKSFSITSSFTVTILFDLAGGRDRLLPFKVSQSPETFTDTSEVVDKTHTQVPWESTHITLVSVRPPCVITFSSHSMRLSQTFTVERSMSSSNIVSRQRFNVETEYEDEIIEDTEEEEEVWSRCARSMHSRSLKYFKGPHPGLPKQKKDATVDRQRKRQKRKEDGDQN